MGQVDEASLRPLLSLHSAYFDLLHRTPLLAQAEAFNLLEHILDTLQQAEAGKQVAFGTTAFHLGVHNLPSSEAQSWIRTFTHFTARPSETDLSALLRELSQNPQILVVLNHPEWDLHKIGDEEHGTELNHFLELNSHRIHAFELNGLRHARENRKVEKLAQRWNQLLISGGTFTSCPCNGVRS